MRAARGSYAAVIREDMAAAGFDDLPRNGAFALALLIHDGGLTHLPEGLGVSKQRLGDLVDTMVVRGYLERSAAPEDGSRPDVSPTVRGRAAQRVTAEASARVNAMLQQRLGAEGFAAFQDGLLALAELRTEGWTDAD